MDALPLFLVLTGSLLHLGWNVLAKGAQDKLAFLWWALLIPALAGMIELALRAYALPQTHLPYICLLASVIVHIFYFWALANAYRFADLSFVYPYSRGIGALVASLAGYAILSERPSPLGLIGVGLTLIAPLIEPLLSRGKGHISKPGWLLTLATGVSIATYLVIDKIGVSAMDPWSYLGLMFLGMWIGLGLMIVPGGRAQREFQHSKFRPLVASFFMGSAYGVVLLAMTQAMVTYVVAARASGIVVSGVAGVLFFKEKVQATRWVAISLITLGVVLIGLA